MNETYARWFRASTPYIRAHSGRTFVVMLGADALGSPTAVNIVHDLALLHVLGVRLVVVHGAGVESDGPVDPGRLADIQAAVALARSKLESLFTTGIPLSPLRDRHIPLASGNLVTARPIGVVGGVDQLAAGTVRRVHVDVIRALLGADSVVLISPVGYGTTGATYALRGEQLAAEVAGDLGADKLIVFDAARRVGDRSDLTTHELRQLRATWDHDARTARRLDALGEACRRGVPRAHLIGFDEDGVLLRELFTAEGAGTQVSDADYRLMRRAVPADASAIIELMRPLEASGALAPRPPEFIERRIEDFFVAELDGTLTGCCALFPLDETTAELACLVGGDAVGPRLLVSVEQAACASGLRRLFALTTQAVDWFLDHGFAKTAVDALPVDRKALYNYRRNSHVLVKDLAGKPGPTSDDDNTASKTRSE
ncbi:MAG: amino-acid N-acetyltransferase [Gammaproteobacteria bacterium]|nr:amino-acid N-acetyltransferase [Gammaproteobacteria bacterium]MXY58117.1 amino-acid N-acetyltransferase [Gammaproteobacteria bacterium]MYF30582.1 amino-acid N-acetyltransferase [Gammaproteobacteria bacterium]MYK48462.1 amino-acid N-acetyltransferase [Gammaproteobacteria bacterium]